MTYIYKHNNNTTMAAERSRDLFSKSRNIYIL